MIKIRLDPTLSNRFGISIFQTSMNAEQEPTNVTPMQTVRTQRVLTSASVGMATLEMESHAQVGLVNFRVIEWSLQLSLCCKTTFLLLEEVSHRNVI